MRPTPIRSDVLAALMLFVVAFLSLPSLASACRCPAAPKLSVFEKTLDVAFWGEVVDRELTPIYVIATLVPKRVFRGKPAELVKVVTTRRCGLGLEVGKNYTIAATEQRADGYYADPCRYSAEDPFPPTQLGQRGKFQSDPLARRFEAPLIAAFDGALQDCSIPDDAAGYSVNFTVFRDGVFDFTEPIGPGTNRSVRTCLRRAIYTRLELPVSHEVTFQADVKRYFGQQTTVRFRSAEDRVSPESTMLRQLSARPDMPAPAESKLALHTLPSAVRTDNAFGAICEIRGHAAAMEFFDDMGPHAPRHEAFAQLFECALRRDDAVAAAGTIRTLHGLEGPEAELVLPILDWAGPAILEHGLPLSSAGRVIPGDAVDRLMLLDWARGSKAWVDLPILLEAVAQALSMAPDGSVRPNALAALAFRRAGLLRPEAAAAYDELAAGVTPDAGVADPAFTELAAAFVEARASYERRELIAVDKLERTIAAEEAAAAGVIASDFVEDTPPVIVPRAPVPPPPPPPPPEDEPLSPWWCLVVAGVGIYLAIALRRGLKRPA